MAVRIYEWDKNETGGAGIEVTDNKVINLILRSLNNLIKINDNNEVYTDLQLDDNLLSTATLPVGVTTGRVLQANGRPTTGTLLCAKTTSGDQVTIIYGDNDRLYIDNGTWTWKEYYNKTDVDGLFTTLRGEISDVWYSNDYLDLDNTPWVCGLVINADDLADRVSGTLQNWAIISATSQTNHTLSDHIVVEANTINLVPALNKQVWWFSGIYSNGSIYVIQDWLIS